MPLAPRPSFRRGLKYVAIRPIRLTSKTILEPGEEVKLPSHRLRSLFQRRRVGPKGHPWTKAMLKTTGFPTDWHNTDEPEVKIDWPLLWPLDREIAIPGHDMTATVAELAELVDEAYEDKESDLTFATTSEEDREHQHDLFIEVIKAELDDLDEDTPDDVDDQDPEDDDETEQPDETAEKQVEPVKVGSRWTLPGLTEEKFTSKKKAKEWLDAQDDSWLDEESGD